MIKLPSLEEMLQAGMHFGHRVSRWHPKMQPYIFGERQGVHVINLELTLEKMSSALEFVKELVASGKTILFVGTKKQAQAAVQAEAERCEMPYITARWVGGLLTNFDEIGKLLERYRQMQQERANNGWDKYTKQERARLEEDWQKKDANLHGIGALKRVPDALFIVDIRHEKTAVEEALRISLPTVALTDSNVNPERVTYAIPGNDDAVKAVALVAKCLADAVLEGKKLRADNDVKVGAAAAAKSGPVIIASA